MQDSIRFYRLRDDWGELSNFAPYPIVMDGQRWPTSEHYFQAQKFLDVEDREAIRLAPSPMMAARMGRSHSRALRPEWEFIKMEVMRRAVMAKFSQHDELEELLLSSGEAVLVEHTVHDSFWGDGRDGSGSNMLGKILMETREALRKKARRAV